MVLAGGFGTRLKPLVSSVPKPLAPVHGKPFLFYLLNNWIAQGITNFVFLLHYEAFQIEEFLRGISKISPFKFTCVHENKPLGTGGAILNAINLLNLNDSFLVTNADTWLDDGIKQVSEISPNIITSVKVLNCERYGSIVTKGDKVIKFIEKSNSLGSGYVSAGLYHLDPGLFKNFSNYDFFSLERDVFPVLIKNRELKSIKLKAQFIDIGIPEDYLKFCDLIRKK